MISICPIRKCIYQILYPHGNKTREDSNNNSICNCTQQKKKKTSECCCQPALKKKNRKQQQQQKRNIVSSLCVRTLTCWLDSTAAIFSIFEVKYKIHNFYLSYMVG